jgi:hypothetical protein
VTNAGNERESGGIIAIVARANVAAKPEPVARR